MDSNIIDLTEDTAPFDFMGIPPEVRLEVYGYALPSEQTFCLRRRSTHYRTWDKEHLMLRVSKVIRQEALPIYLKQNYFIIQMLMEEGPDAAAHLTALAKELGKEPFGGVKFVVTKGAWLRFPNMLPLVELMRSTNGRIRPIATPGVGFVQSTGLVELGGYGAKLGYSLDAAMDMGIRAGQEGWDAEKLRVEFVK